MTTKRERGRDPEQLVTHAGLAAANNFTGMHGELTMVAEAGSQHAAVVQIRAHNGIDEGGYSTPVIPASHPRAPLTYASVPPEFVVTGANLLIIHELGYRPLVQMVNDEGIVISQKQITVSNGALTVAAPPSNGSNDHTHGANVVFQNYVVSEFNNWSVQHHDDESLTVTNNTGEPLTVILR